MQSDTIPAAFLLARSAVRLKFSLAVIIFAAPSTFAQGPSPLPQAPLKELPQLAHFNTANVDTKAEPCDAFYKYANGKGRAAHPIPADQVGSGAASPLASTNRNDASHT